LNVWQRTVYAPDSLFIECIFTQGETGTQNITVLRANSKAAQTITWQIPGPVQRHQPSLAVSVISKLATKLRAHHGKWSEM